MTTAFQGYQRPIDELNEAYAEQDFPHSYDSEIDRLHGYDEAQGAMASEMQRQGGPAYWGLPDEDRQWLMDQVDRWRGGQKTYREAVALFLGRRKAMTEVDAFVAECEERLRRIDEHRTER